MSSITFLQHNSLQRKLPRVRRYMGRVAWGLGVIFSAGLSWGGLPVETFVPVDNIYVPAGFDSNDVTEVIVAGELPNTCHKSPSATVKVVGNKVQITLTALRYQDSNPYCAAMTVPFVERVRLGFLEKGSYQIVVNGNTAYERQGELQVEESASPATDDHVYALVEYVEKAETGRTVTLRGYNPSDCYVLDEVRMVSNQKDTYSVLPIMKQVRSVCPQKLVPFRYEMVVPRDLPKANKVLLHVRVMNGESVNVLFDNRQ